MGFFSWKTQDTDRSISNTASGREVFVVTMRDDKGNAWKEDAYRGYGEFGGKDYYELVAEMNADKLPAGRSLDRDAGLDLCLDDDTAAQLKYPSLSESGKYFDGKEPESCEYQGFFYPV